MEKTEKKRTEIPEVEDGMVRKIEAAQKKTKRNGRMIHQQQIYQSLINVQFLQNHKGEMRTLFTFARRFTISDNV
jgi:hypothetical protein